MMTGQSPDKGRGSVRQNPPSRDGSSGLRWVSFTYCFSRGNREDNEMGITFVGGPYDGMEIDHTLVNRHAKIVPLTGDLGTRLFVFMPPRASWDAVLRGEPAENGSLHLYE